MDIEIDKTDPRQFYYQHQGVAVVEVMVGQIDCLDRW